MKSSVRIEIDVTNWFWRCVFVNIYWKPEILKTCELQFALPQYFWDLITNQAKPAYSFVALVVHTKATWSAYAQEDLSISCLFKDSITLLGLIISDRGRYAKCRQSHNAAFEKCKGILYQGTPLHWTYMSGKRS